MAVPKSRKIKNNHIVAKVGNVRTNKYARNTLKLVERWEPQYESHYYHLSGDSSEWVFPIAHTGAFKTGLRTLY